MTAVLENVNEFSYLGLRRRPIYNELIGLINENEALANPLPNRDATFFKASSEGSFFDGLDHLEVLKEQQQRILQRQVQDLLLRQNVRQSGRTYHLERYRQQSSSDSSDSSSSMTPMTVDEGRETLSVALQADLQRREAQLRDRQRQTGKAHRQALSSQSELPVLQGFISESLTPIFNMIQSPTSGSVFPILPIPSRQLDEEEELIPDEEMLTARASSQELIINSLRFNNPNATRGEVKRASDVLLRYSYLTPEQVVTDFNNFNILNEIYGALNRNGIISDDDMGEYQELTSEISSERKGAYYENCLKIIKEKYMINTLILFLTDLLKRNY